MSWSIAGDYFESCNCEAICPCRMVGDVAGGRSTYGVCFGALSWRIDEGHADGVPLGGLAAVLVLRYDDDESGSPWTFALHVDAHGDETQRTALADIFLGRRGGDGVLRLPWVRKPSNLVAVHASEVEIGGEGAQRTLRVGDAVVLRTSTAVETDQPVACGIPGYHVPGTELYADEFRVDDDPFRWELAGKCAFASRFAYASD